MAYDRLDYGYLRINASGVGDYATLVGSVSATVANGADTSVLTWPITTTERTTIEMTIQVEDTSKAEIESFKFLCHGFGTAEANYTEYAIIFSGDARIGQMDAAISGGNIKISYTNNQGSSSALEINFIAQILESD